MNLYEINEAIMDALERAVDPETGEILDENVLKELNSLEMVKNEKVEGILLWVKQLRADALEIKAEKLALGERQAVLERKADSLQRYIEKTLLPGEVFQTARVEVKWRKSETAEYEGEITALPEKYLRMKAPELDKTALKKALKAGEEIPGAKLVIHNNMQIK